MTDWTDYRFRYSDAGRSTSKRPRSKNDCTVRALATVLDISFDESYEFLLTRGRGAHRGAPNDWLSKKKPNEVLGRTLTWHSFPAVKGEPRMSIGRFVNTYPDGRWIIRISKHVAAVVDGCLYDDATDENDHARCVYGAWEVT